MNNRRRRAELRFLCGVLLLLLAIAGQRAFAAAGDPTIPAHLNDNSFWTVWEGNLSDSVQQIHGVGGSPELANAAMAAKCPDANFGQWVYSCVANAGSCGVITSASVSTQCTHQRTETNTLTGYTVTNTITSPAIKTVNQSYDCLFDSPNSDLVGQLCKCHTGYVSNATSTACVPSEENNQVSKPGTCKSKVEVGDPILPLKGTTAEPVDVGLAVGDQRLVLTYDTARRPASVPALPLASLNLQDPPAFGPLWLSSFHRRLAFGKVSSKGTFSIAAYRGNGDIVSFRVSGGAITADQDVIHRLSALGSGYRLVDAAAQAIEEYDATGALTRMTTRAGAVLTFTYSSGPIPGIAPTAGLLTRVQDAVGRFANLTYASLGSAVLVTQIVDGAGRSFGFAYDSVGNLSAITWPDGTVRRFEYGNGSFPWALTAIFDEKSVRYAMFGYDSAGRASFTQHVFGIDLYSARYTTPPIVDISQVFDASTNTVRRTFFWRPAVGVFVTNPNNSQVQWGTTAVNGDPKMTSRSQPAGSGCAASTSLMTYDANGNVASEDDFNGNRTCRAHDLVRNVAVAQVEGLGNTASCATVLASGAALPSGSRKTSTQWHPDWRLETRRAEPLKVTTWVYNGQPDPFNGGAIASCAPATALLPDSKPIVVLCRQVEQATTDVNGALGFGAALQAGVPARQHSWTYNQRGQVLAAKGPRTDVNETTTYAYYATSSTDYTVGDLQRMTNPLGQSASYPKYNKSGQVLRMVDANGVVTDNTYDLRQHLTSSTVGGQQTLYAYDPVGQLVGVTLPDTTTMTYTWDDAHRLTKVVDQSGNSITYTLDYSGNRTADEIKDSRGVLTRRVLRTFDALGRAQQVTGAAQ